MYILEGKVTVNGKTIKELGTKINPEKDEICYNGKKVNKQEKKVYILLNKPIGYVTTVKDQFNRDTVMDLIKIKERIVPVVYPPMSTPFFSCSTSSFVIIPFSVTVYVLVISCFGC